MNAKEFLKAHKNADLHSGLIGIDYVAKLMEEYHKAKLALADVSGSTLNQKPIWSDYYLNKYRWYRKCRKQTWYKHQFTNDALELSISFTGTWWALYGKINRYSDVVDTEVW